MRVIMLCIGALALAATGAVAKTKDVTLAELKGRFAYSIVEEPSEGEGALVPDCAAINAETAKKLIASKSCARTMTPSGIPCIRCAMEKRIHWTFKTAKECAKDRASALEGD